MRSEIRKAQVKRLLEWEYVGNSHEIEPLMILSGGSRPKGGNFHLGTSRKKECTFGSHYCKRKIGSSQLYPRRDRHR